MPDSLDVFIVAGQSNAVGRGDAADAPRVPEGVAYEYDDGLVHLEHPIGDDHTPEDASGSAWTAFACRYHELTGRSSVYVAAAVGGSALHAAADGETHHWDVDAGSPYVETAVETTVDCLDHLDATDTAYVLRGVLWSQGERDAQAIDNGTVTPEAYRGKLEALVATFRDRLDRPDLDVFVFRTGRMQSGDTPGFEAVRDGQEAVATADANVHIVFRGALDFPAEGKMSDEYHYTQSGYNQMGRVGAESVARVVGDHNEK